jgi:surfactin synthase thioesterase subunit
VTAFLRPRPVASPEVRLVVVHHAGGSAASYSPLARRLPPTWEVLLQDLPGRGKRADSRLLHDPHDLVRRVVADLAEVWNDGVPLALFGHSLGAMVVAEVAAVLCAGGTPPVWTGVSGRLAPAVQVPRRSAVQPLHLLSDAGLLEALQALGGIPEELAEMPGFLDRFLRVARADLTAVGTYRRRRGELVLDCPLSVFGGVTDPWAPRALLRHWRSCTRATYSQQFFDGGHFYFGDGFQALAAGIQGAVASVPLPVARLPRTLAAALPA